MGELKEKFESLNGRQITRVEIINIMLYATILIMPLIVVKVSKFRYSLGKLMFLYVVGIFLIINIFREIIKNKKFKFRKEYISLGIFLLTILIASILSPYKNIAFIGNAVRNEGFITIAIYVLLFIASSQYLKITEKSIDIIIGIGSLHGLYGILQFYHIDPIQKWALEAINADDSIGLLGNKMFFSAYITLFLVLSISLYIFKWKKRYLISSLILFSTLICTLTRSGWLSFLFVCIIGFFMIIRRKDCLKRVVVLVLTFSVIVFTLNITSDGRVLGRVNHTIGEVNGLSQNSEESTEEAKDDSDKNIVVNASLNSRKEILKLYIQAFRDSPFLGTGPDTFNERLADDYPIEYLNKLINTGEGADKAHNEYLEYATSCGIFTLISYLILLEMIIYGLIKNIKDDKNKIILLTILGYMIQAFFNISVIGVAPLFWILLGYAVKVIYENNDLKEKDIKKTNKS